MSAIADRRVLCIKLFSLFRGYFRFTRNLGVIVLELEIVQLKIAHRRRRYSLSSCTNLGPKTSDLRSDPRPPQKQDTLSPRLGIPRLIFILNSNLKLSLFNHQI